VIRLLLWVRYSKTSKVPMYCTTNIKTIINTSIVTVADQKVHFYHGLFLKALPKKTKDTTKHTTKVKRIMHSRARSARAKSDRRTTELSTLRKAMCWRRQREIEHNQLSRDCEEKLDTYLPITKSGRIIHSPKEGSV
jgi:carotenoid cleavage dioxygenase-like enzyme